MVAVTVAGPRKPTNDEIRAAKQLLEANGYVVVERDRVVEATVDYRIELRDLDVIPSPDLLMERVRHGLALHLGEEIAKRGAALVTDEINHLCTHRRVEYRVTVIMPERKP
ncbi:hypothetical protein [Bradyrhizobium erythrophlei]|uniref:Uncharacterized protein n=1 Tax=Bradyrhizobium erythrophlei TaxID=1437360 RepID=A0A1M5NM07_9BRAD|nr:hypothetical protein [Bradyrhizobium erythrophlei]SHG90542.1 hypothetical protein SAMN05443248_3046 [Bradyrhizobium erythrophlei]